MGNGANDALSRGTFALHCRGDVRLYRDDLDCTPKSKKGRALLAILAAEQRPLTRVRIIDLLWSDRQEEQARGSLRTLLADLREQFNSDLDNLLVVDRERVALAAGVRTDLADPTIARPAGELFEGLDHIDPELDEWLRVEREKWSDASFPALKDEVDSPVTQRSRLVWETIAGLALLIATLAALLYFQPWVKPPQPVIAVLKFRDATKANAAVADGLAEQLRIELAQYPDIGVISIGSIEAEQLTGKPLPTVAKLLGATHVLEGTIVPHDAQLQLSLRLYRSGEQRPTWTAHLPASGPGILLGRDAVAPRIAELVGDIARRPTNDAAMRADEKAYSDLFRARSLAQSGDPPKLEEGRRILFEIVSRYPDFVPALVTLARTTMILSDHPIQGLGGVGGIPMHEARAEAERFARRAIAIAPDYGPAYNALGSALQPTDASFEPFCRAAELSPGSGYIQSDCGYAYIAQGQHQLALRYRGVGAKLDPLNQAAQWNYAQALLTVGKAAEARKVINDYLSRGIPNEQRLQMIANSETNLFGDWSNSYVATAQVLRMKPNDVVHRHNMMWPMLLMFGQKAAAPYGRPGSMTRLILSDDFPGVVKRMTQLDDEFWSLEYETGATLHYLLMKGRADLVVAAFDRAVGHGAPPTALNSEHMIAAFRLTGRNKEADAFVKDAASRIAKWDNTDLRVGAFKMSMQAALARRFDEAIRLLRIAHKNHWWSLSEVLDHPYNDFAYKELRRDPRFRALVADYDRWVEQERRDSARRVKQLGLPPPPSSPPPAAALS